MSIIVQPDSIPTIQVIPNNNIIIVAPFSAALSTGGGPEYDSEIVVAPTSGTLTLKQSTETYIGSLTNSNSFTVALPVPRAGIVNESILIFKIGATLPTITQPSGIVWRGATPTLAINQTWTIVYEQVNTTGTTFEIYAVAVKNV